MWTRKLVSRSLQNFRFQRFLCCETSTVNSSSSAESVRNDNFKDLNVGDKQMLRTLQQHMFSDEESSQLMQHFNARKQFVTNLNHDLVDKSIRFWTRELRPDHAEGETGISQDLRKLFCNVEPDLLLVSVPEMEKRLDDLLKIGFLAGRGDLCRVIKYAPKGYLFQEWKEITKKFFYFQYVVMEWWLKATGSKDPYPYPHPLVKYPLIIEKTYYHIKTRYLFSVYSGFKSTSVATSLKSKNVDFQVLLLDEVDSFLHKVAPNCTEEEYYVFEDMVTEMDDETDDIVADLTELGGEIKSYNDANSDEKVKKKRKRRRK